MEQVDRATLSTPVMETETVAPFETSVHLYLATRCHTQECISQAIIMGGKNGYESTKGLSPSPLIVEVLNS